MIVPPGSGEQVEFLTELSLRLVPSFDFFLFSLLAGVALGLALLLDAPALFILAALLAPFMAPVLGISLGTITGTARFVLMSLGSLSIGSLIVFLCGMVAGWVVVLLPDRAYTQAGYYGHFHWEYFAVLAIGSVLTHYLIVRAPNQRPLVTSVAIAYGLYLPAGAAGFGLSSGIPGLWPGGLGLFGLHLLWTAIIGMLVLRLLKIRPINVTSYVMGGTYIAIAAIALLFLPFQQPASAPAGQPAAGNTRPTMSDGVFAKLPATSSPSATASAVASVTPVPPSSTPTPTRTLVPTNTVTLTITPQPTPVWARINASEGNGAIIRVEPNYDASVIQALLNGTLVEVLADQVVVDKSATWVRVRTVDGKEGWIVRSLLRTATPAPGW